MYCNRPVSHHQKTLFSNGFRVQVFILSIHFIYGLLLAQSINETMPATIPQEIITDWETQDSTASVGYPAAVDKIVKNLSADYAQIITTKKATLTGKELYLAACHYRRISRMKPYTDDIRKLIFTRHHNFGGMTPGFLEGISPSRDELWADSSALCLLEFKDYYSRHTYLIEDKTGVIKDPCVSFDATKVIFAWSKKTGTGGYNSGTGFKLFEIKLDDPSHPVQLTSNPTGLTVSDYEPCYLQNDDIVFISSRCFGMVDCAFNLTSNLYICNSKGEYLRRVGYDQVHTLYPVLLSDGRVLYTRWEYNDRNIMNVMGLFTMNPDGTHQTELYGNQTNWPATFIHGRQIPGTTKIMSVISGHRAPYSGDLVIVDPNIARNGLTGIQLIAPVRKPPSNTSYGADIGGGVKYLFENPSPLDEDNFLTAWRPSSEDLKTKFNLYFMNIDGTRELLSWDKQSVSQPVLVKKRSRPPMPTTTVDYRVKTASFTMQDVYMGSGMLKGNSYGGVSKDTVARGTAKKIRVVALEYRAPGDFGFSGSRTTGFNTTPAGRWTTSWETKKILGETPIYEDGSAAFIVPARVPVYFQVLDANGYCIQTMRSWATLQPGEQFSCLGCHEDKTHAPVPGKVALAGEPKPLQPFAGLKDVRFNYRKIVQPIWDKNCVKCHKPRHTSGLDLTGEQVWTGDLNSTEWADDYQTRRYWAQSYLSLTKEQKKYIDWITIFDMAAARGAYPPGASTSPLMKNYIMKGHQGVELTREEKELVACWIDLCAPHSGYYTEDMNATDSTAYAKSLAKRIQHEAIEEDNIAKFIAAGQYGIIGTRDSYRKTHPYGTSITNNQFIVQYLAHERILKFSVHGKAKFMLLDLNGRCISAVDVEKSDGEAFTNVALPNALHRGIYVACLRSNGISKQKMITVIK